MAISSREMLRPGHRVGRHREASETHRAAGAAPSLRSPRTPPGRTRRRQTDRPVAHAGDGVASSRSSGRGASRRPVARPRRGSMPRIWDSHGVPSTITRLMR